MALRTALERQIAFFQQLALRALPTWGFSADSVTLDLIKYRENAVFSVQTSTGRYALRIHRDGYHSDAALRSELQWLAALKLAGLPVPTVIPTLTQCLFGSVSAANLEKTYNVDLFSWVSGESLETYVPKIAADVPQLSELYFQIGAVAAQLHNQAQQWQSPPGFTRQAWDAAGLVGDAPLWGKFWEYAGLTAAQRQLILTAKQKIYADLVDYGEDRGDYGLIHADFVQGNLMVSGGQLQVIDFDDAGYGWHLFELATAMYFLQEHQYYEEIKTGLITGYRSERALTDAQLGLLPLFLAARGLTYLGWLQTRPVTKTSLERGSRMVRLCMATVERYLADS